MTTITQENVKFNGVLENAAVLADAANVRTLILTDDLSAGDRALLDAFVAKYGSNPLAGPTAGVLTADFPATTIGATTTGLDNVAAATAGVLTVNIGGNKAGADASGLSAAVGTSGSQTINLRPDTAGASATGLANDATAYTLTVSIDGASVPVSVVGSASQTITTLIAAINVDLGSTAVAALVGGDLKITSATQGAGSRVAITGGTLLASLTPYVGVFPAADGKSTGRTYSAVVTIDGSIQRSVRFLGTAGATLTNVLTEINTDLAGSATASIVGGNLVITSATTGAGSSVVAQDTGSLFSSLTGYVGISSVAGTAPRVYTAFLIVDGVTIPISFQGSTAQTFTTLLAAINADLGVAATAALASGNITVTSATTGLTSKVEVALDGLFKHVAGFKQFTTTPGAVDLVDAMQAERVGSSSLFDLFDVKVVGDKPAVPPVPAVLPKTPAFSYYGGSPLAWRYLEDDTEVNP